MANQFNSQFNFYTITFFKFYFLFFDLQSVTLDCLSCSYCKRSRLHTRFVWAYFFGDARASVLGLNDENMTLSFTDNYTFFYYGSEVFS